MYRLYEFSSSGNCYKLRLAMAQLGVPFERVEKDITRGETRSDDFLAINPNGRIPVLVTPDGRTLPESNAALWYLARDSQLMPTDAFEQAQVLQWMFFEQYNHEPNIATSRYWLHVL
ncbi:glutathione S-transferase, partial [Alcanivorax sp. HI0044]|uniref:glutathione S-transferase n=2 Tax=Alcanivorax TaxID=59753 RepID=UPI000ACE4627